jgi:hypothetical protein
MRMYHVCVPSCTDNAEWAWYRILAQGFWYIYMSMLMHEHSHTGFLVYIWVCSWAYWIIQLLYGFHVWMDWSKHSGMLRELRKARAFLKTRAIYPSVWIRPSKHGNHKVISRWGTAVPTATIGFGIFRGSAIADRKSPLYTNFHYDTSRF